MPDPTVESLQKQIDGLRLQPLSGIVCLRCDLLSNMALHGLATSDMKKFWTCGHVGNIRLLVKDAVHLQVLNACAKLWASHCLILFLHFLAFLGIGVSRFELRTTCSFQPATYGVTFQAPMRPHPSYRMPPWSPQRYRTQSCSLKLAISCLSIFVDICGQLLHTSSYYF